MKHLPTLLPLAASFVLLASACGDSSPEKPTTTTGSGSSSGSGGGSGGSGSSSGSGGSGGSASAGDPPTLPLTWTPCNLFTVGPAVPAKCAEPAVPLFWGDPASPSIQLTVKRLPAKGERRGSLWLLDGGPGGGGVGLEGVAYAIAQQDGGLDIYIPQHRGTGNSTKLTCPEADEGSAKGIEITAEEWPGCINALKAQWGDGLAGFSTTEAARDLAALIASTADDNARTFVLGSSYGTYLANRYLRLYPAQASAVIYDSICPPDGCHLDQFDVEYDKVASAFLDLCAADATCSSHLGASPRDRLGDLYESLDQGHCPAMGQMGLDRRALRTLLGVMLNDWNARLGIAPVIRRIERCDPEDVAAVGHLVEALFGEPGDPPGAFLRAWSFPLANNITFSELWSAPPPSAEEMIAASDATYIAQGVSLGDAEVFPLWPRYERDAYFGEWGDNALPMLMMNGDLDPATPISMASEAGAHFTGPHQTFVTLPRSPHGTLGGSPIDPSGETCGMKLLLAFLADPEAPLDTSCKDKVLPLNFAGAPWLAQKLFGTDDMFSNSSPKP